MLNHIYVNINFCLPGCTHRTLEEDVDEKGEDDYDNDEQDFNEYGDDANHIEVDIDVAVTLAVLAELSCHPPNVPHLQVGFLS